MRIVLVSPPQANKGGNSTTADRWTGLLRGLGHTVSHGGGEGELLVALHARKTASAIQGFRGPVIVAATGTDLYVDLPDSAEALRSLEIAQQIVVLNHEAIRALPPACRPRARVILQSVEKIEPMPAKDEPYTVLSIGHLRAVKDPLLVAEAATRLPLASRIRVVQIGAELEPGIGDALSAYARKNERYRWAGPLPRHATLRTLAAAHLLVIASRLEGGANVVGEAIVHGVPPFASRIDGNVGLLGSDWPAYFEPGDSAGLATLLCRWEADSGFRGELAARCSALEIDFSLARERAAWQALLEPYDCLRT